MTHEFMYLASPYSKHPDGIEQAFINVCKAAAHLMEQGYIVLSPIAHTHPVAVHGGLDPYNCEFFISMDKPLMDAASGCIVYMDDSWEDSKGVAIEIEEFFKQGKPILYMTKDYEIVSAPTQATKKLMNIFAQHKEHVISK